MANNQNNNQGRNQNGTQGQSGQNQSTEKNNQSKR